MASSPIPREGERNESIRKPEERRSVQSGRSETEGRTMRENTGPNEAQCRDEEEEYQSRDEEDDYLGSEEDEESPGDRAGAGNLEAMGEPEVDNNPDVQHFQALLKVRGIRLPEGVLIQGAVERSREPDVMEDAALIKRALVNEETCFRKFPHLTCEDVKNAWNKMNNNKAREITKMTFLKKRSGGRGRNQLLLERVTEIKRKCFEYFKQEILPIVGEGEIQSHQVEYSGLGEPVQFGFLKGKVDFLATVRNSRIKEIIIQCKKTRGDMVGKVFTKPSEGHRAELIKTHPYYYQTLSYKYILQNLPQVDPGPVRAVMVLRHQSGDNQPEFYWNFVDGDLEKIHRLNEFCKEEALPRFLALLQLMDQTEHLHLQ